MAKFKNFSLGVENSTARQELNLMKNQDSFNLQFINISDLDKSPFNHFKEYKESNPTKYNEIKESIRHLGIINPLKVIPVDGQPHKYEVLGGWNKRNMVEELIAEGDTRYLKGVPCRVLPKNTPEIDQQIIAELDNTGEGHTDPVEVRESIARLAKLYKEKNIELGINSSIVKQISNNTGIGERQVQRYNAINQKLIPELQTFFDEKKLNIESASKIAAMDEDAQRLILFMVQSGESIGKEEIQLAKEQNERMNISLAETKEKIKALEISLEEERKNTSNEKLQALRDELELKELEAQEKEETLKTEIEKLKQQSSSNEETENKINELRRELRNQLNVQAEIKQQLENENQERIQKKEEEINQLKKQLETLKTSDEILIFSEEEKEKLKDTITLNNILDDTQKRLANFYVTLDHYKYTLDEEIVQQICKLNDTLTKINKKVAKKREE